MRIHQVVMYSGKEEEQPLRDAVRDEGCIPSICYGDRYPDPFHRAAYYLQRISTRHPFIEGNKRTAFLVACAIIHHDTEFMIEDNMEENDEFVRAVASEIIKDEKEIVKWFKNHVIRSKI